METNLDGDRIAAMEGIDLKNNGFLCTYTYGLSNSHMIDVDDLVSSVCCPVIDNSCMSRNSVDDDTGLCHIANSSLGCNDACLFMGISGSFRIVSDYSVEVDTKKIFRLGDVHVLFHLTTMAH